MRRAFGLALVTAALAVPQGAAAAVPGPTVLDFEDQRVGALVGFAGQPDGEVYAGRSDVSLSDNDRCGQVAEPGGNSAHAMSRTPARRSRSPS